MSEKSSPKDEHDTHGWARFERAVDVALHTPAKHKPKAEGESSPPKPAQSPKGAGSRKGRLRSYL